MNGISTLIKRDVRKNPERSQQSTSQAEITQ